MENKNENIDTNSSLNQNINPVKAHTNDNIFKELSGDLDFGSSNEEVVEENKKDEIYYMKLSIKVMIVANIILFVFGFFSYLYVKIQNNDTMYSKSFLDPICFLLSSSEVDNTGEYCSSVSSLIKDYDAKIVDLKTKINTKLSTLLEDIYLLDNFVYSKEVSFLLNEKNTKLKVLDMLNDFDLLKNDFSGTDKKMIVCDGFDISSQELSVNCNAFSSFWESKSSGNGGIIGEKGIRNKDLFIEGTSITIAASFLNFIEKNSSYGFKLVDKQKTFNSEIIVGEGPYVRKTPFQLKLKYNKNNNLSF